MKISFDSGEQILIERLEQQAKRKGIMMLNKQDVQVLQRILSQMKQVNVEPQHFEATHGNLQKL